jgi:hypothetical protein
MGGAKTTKKTQQNNNNRKGMPVEEWRKDGVAPFNTPPQLEGASNHGSKVARKEKRSNIKKSRHFHSEGTGTWRERRLTSQQKM